MSKLLSDRTIFRRQSPRRVDLDLRLTFGQTIRPQARQTVHATFFEVLYYSNKIECSQILLSGVKQAAERCLVQVIGPNIMRKYLGLKILSDHSNFWIFAKEDNP
jgi:hypothetical protein